MSRPLRTNTGDSPMDVNQAGGGGRIGSPPRRPRSHIGSQTSQLPHGNGTQLIPHRQSSEIRLLKATFPESTLSEFPPCLVTQSRRRFSRVDNPVSRRYELSAGMDKAGSHPASTDPRQNLEQRSEKNALLFLNGGQIHENMMNSRILHL